MSVENLDLGHILDDFESVVRLFGKWVTEQVKLLQILEVGQELQELVQVPQLVVSNEEDVQELVLGKTSDI